MIYIFVALKPEAQAFVDKYKLKKERVQSFTIYKDTHFLLIITGLGVLATQKATQFILDTYAISSKDIFVNIGICASKSDKEIGKLLEIGKVKYNNEIFILNPSLKNTLTCLDYEAKSDNYDIVDMESYGFYKTLHTQKNIYIFKVVSDHFEPHKVTKEKTKQLIFTHINEILKKVHQI